MSGTLQLGGTNLAVHSGSGASAKITLDSGLVFPAGHIIQVIESKKTDIDDVNTNGGTNWSDWTGTDQNGSGSIWCVKITPQSQSSKILVVATGAAGMDGGYSGWMRVARIINGVTTTPYLGDAATNYYQVGSCSFYGGSTDSNNNETFSMIFLDSPNTENEITYKCQGSTQGNYILRINTLGSNISNTAYAARSPSSIIVMEIKQ